MDYLTYTSDILLPTFVTEVQFGSPVFAKIITDAKQSSQNRIRRAVQVYDSASATSYYGSHVFNTVEENNDRDINFEYKDYGTQVTVNRSEIVRGQVPGSKVIDIIGVKAQEAVQGLQKRIYTDAYGDGTGNGGLNMNGFANIIDDGTVAPTYGGLSRTTYPSLQSYVGAIGTLTLDDMVTAWNNAKWDSNMPDMVAVNQTTLYGTIEAFLSNKQQNMVITKPVSDSSMMKQAGLQGYFGFDTLFFKGAPVLGDRYCQDDVVYFINSNFMRMSYLENAVPDFNDVKANMGMTTVKGAPDVELNSLGISASNFLTQPGGTAFTATTTMTLQLDGDPRYHSKLIVG